MTGAKRDGRKKNNVCEYREISIPEQGNAPRRRPTSPARTSLTVADIEAMALCGNFGIAVDRPTARCAAFGTPDMADDSARFAVIVSFEL